MMHLWSAPLRKCYVYACDNLHVKNSDKFVSAIGNAIDEDLRNFSINLTALQDQDSSDVLVSTRAVVHMAKVIAKISSYNEVTESRECLPLVLALQIGRLDSIIVAGDAIVVLSNDAAVVKTFHGVFIKSVPVIVITIPADISDDVLKR